MTCGPVHLCPCLHDALFLSLFAFYNLHAVEAVELRSKRVSLGTV